MVKQKDSGTQIAVSLFDQNFKVACHVHENNHHMEFAYVKVVGHEANFQSEFSSLVVNLRPERWERPHRHSKGLQISGVHLTPVIRLKHYEQLFNNFLALACTFRLTS